MKLISLYLMASVCYLAYACIGFSNEIRNSPYYMWLGLTAALIGNVMWIIIAKTLNDPNEIFVAGFVFDFIILLTFVAAPMLMGEAQEFNRFTGLGVFTIVGGILITKWSLA